MAASRLHTDTLQKLPDWVSIPEYDRSGILAGIVHVGVGNFHRAHEAYFTDQLLNQGDTKLGICGICLLESDLKMYHTLTGQDGLYSLTVKEADGTQHVRVIGSIIEYLYAPSDPSRVIEKMADPTVKIISLTITEGGYNYDPATGRFLFSDPGIQWDLKHPDRPRTIFGYLSAALRLRRQRGRPGLTVLSCDNIQQNGTVCRNMLISYIQESSPELGAWVEDQVSFPNSMVDRITPVTTSKEIEELKVKIQLEDSWPVVCEPFIQWVIEDDFAQGRPPWEKAGVQFVNEVEPYEKMKIRLLNAGHSLLGFFGSLQGYSTIHEAVQDELLARFLRAFMDEEVTPLLGTIEGVDLESYKKTLIGRFGNPHMGDLLSRICSESSAKIPKFLLPTIAEQLQGNGKIKYAALVVAAWCRYLELAGTDGYEYEVQDVMQNILKKRALASMGQEPLAFLKIDAVFGDLYRSVPFVEIYLHLIGHLRKNGATETIRHVLKELPENQ